MTIDDLIPDKEINVGGRPPKTEEEKNESNNKYAGRSPDGRAFTENCDNKEWWIETLEECIGATKLPYNDDERKKAILELAEYTYLFPIEVRTQLEKHGIYEFDWKGYIAHRPHLFNNPRLPENWREITSGQNYTMGETAKIFNGEIDPYYEQLENPEKFRSKNNRRRKSKKRNIPSGGAFSDLINDKNK